MELLGLWVTLAVGLIGYLITYLYSLHLAKRADRLKYLTAQLDELYGPLYVITQAGQILFKALSAKRDKRKEEDNPELLFSPEQEDQEWRLWVKEVFQPLNEKLEQVIIGKAHLVIEEDMPQTLKRFLAHSAGYKAVIKQWELGNYIESASIIEYPVELAKYAEDSFKTLRKEQLKLIGHRNQTTEDSQVDDDNELG
jgi:hypothetical protein